MSVLTLDGAKMLISNSPVPTTRYSYEQVQRMIEAAEQQVAEVVGPLAPTPVTVSAVNGGLGLALPVGPYIGPTTAISRSGVALTSWASTYVDGAGIMHGLPPGAYQLTYMAGWAALPPKVYTAIEEQFLHLWSFRRGSTRADTPGAAHAMPWRVSELIESYRWERWP